MKCFLTIVFIFIVISTTFRPICPPVFFMCLSNSVIYTEHRTTSFIESTGFACSDSVSQNRVLSIYVLLLACSHDWTCDHYDARPLRSLENQRLKVRGGSQVQQTPEEGWRKYQPKHYGNNNKDEDNSPKTLNGKKPQTYQVKYWMHSLWLNDCLQQQSWWKKFQLL